ncbi:MAG: matrixin family metalloprotease [Pseudomonadales bacterium]|nr:matrixin family metalloprotease [Pseudomonadales bacterium]
MTSTKTALLLVLLGISLNAFAANIPGKKWPGNTTEMYIGMPGTAPSGIAWSDALRKAAQAWNDTTPFTFTFNSQFLDPCTGYSKNPANSNFPNGDGDSRNGTGFNTTVCGNDFGSGVLAVTLIYTESNLLGAEDITEADIVFNSNERYDIYDGPLRFQTRTQDFGRIALHELGHVLGLGHEQTASAIMKATIGNLDSLQEDDINGATTLYNGYRNCPVTSFGFGRSSGSLATGDCRVRELIGGGSDDSFVDTYEFELAQPTQITLEMRSPSLDSVLVLMDARSDVLDVDDDGAGGCNSRITTTLAAGTYAVLANTFDGKSDCGDTFGPYELTLSYQSSTLPLLGRETSLRGGSSTARFSGGVTQNGGLSYSNLAKSTQPVDIKGSIQVDSAHQGKAGFIVVAAVMDNGRIYLRNSVGEFVPYDQAGGVITKAYSKVLGAVENVDILRNFTPLVAGYPSAQVNFLMGYGLSSNPDELYFHAAPINLLTGL